ncbi:hypothetical protein [Bifidobacterium gallicum]|uniref:Uncharacterized protein n=1 Tax=Bifidobacterium gallicum DSM 20093 = LMG 11596 TaxID=561180 RepID=D1NSG8_9BIFI|nr:hypothetical protein [Bifidobacterium gallicum]EFA23620.1 hypothetical protein BIFGAL_02725 [Bifidobacterium gallicum DSM 20093 = LMG 11596]
MAQTPPTNATIEPLSQALQRLLFPNVLDVIDVLPSRFPINGAAIGAALMAAEEAKTNAQ